jgi:hypothetical protein
MPKSKSQALKKKMSIPAKYRKNCDNCKSSAHATSQCEKV